MYKSGFGFYNWTINATVCRWRGHKLHFPLVFLHYCKQADYFFMYNSCLTSGKLHVHLKWPVCVLPGWAGSPSWRGSHTLRSGSSCCSHPGCPCWPVACFYMWHGRTVPSLVAVATHSVPPASVCAWFLWEKIGFRSQTRKTKTITMSYRKL